MAIRLKFRVIQKNQRIECERGTRTVVTLTPVLAGSEENKKAWQFEPRGSIDLEGLTQAAADKLPLGAELFVTFEPAP